MAEPITIRNLTAQPLTVKAVERYEAPNAKDFPPNAGFSLSNVTANFTKAINLNTSSPTHYQLGEKAESFAKQDVDLRMEPFTTHQTEIKTTERSPSEILRLTFEGDGGGRWRIDTPTPSPASQVLTALTPDPKHEYTAIYFSERQFLALFESTNMKAWMKEFEDETPLSALSIPGTHNSPTHYKALPSVRCQAVSPREQLDNGVRFFDIRVQPTEPEKPESDGLNLVHAVFPISLTGPKKFRDLCNMAKDWLKANPSETLIMSLKREGTGNATDQQLSIILKDHYTNSTEWWTQPHIPTLGEARGKIVLMRRFANADRLKGEWGGRGWGLNAENWADNTANCTAGDVCVQDFYEVLETENIEKKINYCCAHFELCAAVVNPVPGVTTDSTNPVPPGPLFLNFLSASNFWKTGCWPEQIAAKINPATISFLCEKHGVGDQGIDAPGQEFGGDGGVGIVVTDWCGKNGDWDLIRCIVGMNSRLLLRQRGIGWR
ncbi:PLC-like phosphodiesterase [Teratosphaeria nubilosa]|uniref:PLC-like phosphodiesterase n=1 Tax=Teratosphaeria nubilosa TaxID=161662 RepID=A0A6G1LEH6_9PEZI|nr:PLC-like phosphodiesterase [Teratosphaeria nubilosa]